VLHVHSISFSFIILITFGEAHKILSSNCASSTSFPLCLTKHHAMKTYWGSGGVAPRILNLGARWRWVVSFMTHTLYVRRNNPRYPLDRRLCGPQSRSGRGGEEKSSHPLPALQAHVQIIFLNLHIMVVPQKKKPVITPIITRHPLKVWQHSNTWGRH
jgi:hypothetical protein